MELLKIEFSDNKIRLFLDDGTSVSYVIEMPAGDFFDKLASAFYSARAIKPEADK